MQHPYRKAASAPADGDDAPVPTKICGDDITLAVMLFVLGVLLTWMGISNARGLELSLGLLCLALAAKVVRDGRRAARSRPASRAR